jgi:hypothetical protein
VVSKYVDNDRGNLDNVFRLSEEELKCREVVSLDIAANVTDAKDYQPNEDPALCYSEKAGRAPLTSADWIVRLIRLPL